jgi:hypothetical protein
VKLRTGTKAVHREFVTQENIVSGINAPGILPSVSNLGETHVHMFESSFRRWSAFLDHRTGRAG